VFGAEIYQLYEKIDADEDFDLFGLIKERANNESLSGRKRDDFSEIYLFFDYEAHSTLANDEKMAKMLSTFDNETDTGKLYISYPMVEALRHIVDYGTFDRLCVKCKGDNCQYKDDCEEWDSCREEPRYKAVVGRDGLKELQNMNSPGKWIKVIAAHLSKMNDIVNCKYEFPAKTETQQAIFAKQLEKHINKRCPEVAVLSAFPVFVHDYYGNNGTRKRLGI
jgi:hypothetical protein